LSLVLKFYYALNLCLEWQQFEMVIAGLEAGQPVDLNSIPPPPPSSASIPDNAKVEAQSQKHEQPETEPAQEASEEG
jgi:hypothetical protein